MKHKNVIQFGEHAKPVTPRMRGRESATVIILPTVKVERFGEPSMTDPPFAPPPKPERRSTAARRIRAKLQKQSETVESALMWLASMVIEGAEPQAVAAFLARGENGRYLDSDFRLAATWLHEFALAWQREQRRDAKI